MSGTVEGGRKAYLTNIKKHGQGFYQRIGQMGGWRGHTGGFASNKIGPDGLTGPQRARVVGAKGGKISRRGPRETTTEVDYA